MLSLVFSFVSCMDNFDKSISDSKIDGELILGDWVLTNQKIIDSVLVFKKSKILEKSKYNSIEFLFETDKLTTDIYNPMVGCGNGRIYFDTCSYFKREGSIHLKMKGGYSMESRFDIHGEYSFELIDSNQFKLNLERFVKKKITGIFDEME